MEGGGRLPSPYALKVRPAKISSQSKAVRSESVQQNTNYLDINTHFDLFVLYFPPFFFKPSLTGIYNGVELEPSLKWRRGAAGEAERSRSLLNHHTLWSETITLLPLVHR